MYGLTSILSTAANALNADDGAISITNNNIANVNTAGYSRQTVNLSPSALAGSGVLQNNGVTFGGFTSVRDEILQLSINQQTSNSGSLTSQSTSLSQIETNFSSTSSGLGSAISNFFSNLSGLSTNPASAASRQTAYSSASELVNAFHQAASTLTSSQSSADQTVAATVTQINQLSSQIATLDQQLTTVQLSGGDGGSLEDQRDALTTQLAQLTGIDSIKTGTQPILTLSNGTPLVSNNQAETLQTGLNSSGQTRIFDSQGNDITDSITGGTLGGAITTRDTTIPGFSSTLDTFASQFATAVNSAQTQGYDANGNTGTAMFTLPTTGSAAAGISLALASPSGIAASSDGSSGSSGNLTNLLAVQTNALPSGQTPTNTYSSFVQTIGTASSEASANLSATTASLSQMTTQQSTESGVSVDEETTNLIKFQQAYSAAAQVISTVNSLFSVVLNMSQAA